MVEKTEMGNKQQEIMDALMDMIPMFVMASVTMKMLSDAYNENPAMFWSYFREKHRDVVFNCRM